MEEDLEELAQLLAEQNIRRLENCPPLDRLDYTFDLPLEGDGWHSRETNGTLFWRFTGPASVATLYFPRIRMPERTIRFSVFHAVTPAHLEQLRVTYNGVGLNSSERRFDRVTFRVPDSAIQAGKYTVIELATPPAAKPVEGDDRLLGVGFTRIEAF